MSIRPYIRQVFRFLLPLLYGRSRFRLFLKTSVEDLDVRLRMLASVTDLYSAITRPIRIQAPFGKSMLVIAPHQDDETIGCGGAMALQKRAGGAVSILLLNDGAVGHDDSAMTRPQLAELRNQESRRAAAALGIDPPRFLGHPDLSVGADRIATEVAEVLESQKIDVVFAPSVLDLQPDHRRGNYILAEALRQANRNIRVFGYEVWGFCIPNTLVVIDDVIDLKTRALDCFQWANTAVNYTWTTKGINMYRSRFTEVGVCQYAECFLEMPSEEFVRVMERLKASDADHTLNIEGI